MRRLALTCWFLSLALGQENILPTVAVLEFDTEGMGNVASSALASIVRTEIIKSKQYRVVDRNSVNEILTEQGFSQTGCVSSECAVEVGKLLGIQKMVTGTLSGLGSLYILDLQLIDVATGEIEKIESVQHVGEIEDLIAPLRETTRTLVLGTTASTLETAFYITSTPAGAQVFIDGRLIGSTPIKESVEVGTYSVLLKAPGYADWTQTVESREGETVLVQPQLLEVRSTQASEVGPSSSSEIGKWEVLGITREEYVQFLRLGIDEREWIEVYQPAGVTLALIEILISSKVPKEHWIEISKIGISVTDIRKLHELGVRPELWSLVPALGGLNALQQYTSDGHDANASILSYMPSGISTDDLESFEKTESRTIKTLISAGMISQTEYDVIVARARIVAVRASFITDPNSLNSGDLESLSQAAGIPIESNQRLFVLVNNWRQSLLMIVRYSDRPQIQELVKSLTVWEWAIARRFNISEETFLRAALQSTMR